MARPLDLKEAWPDQASLDLLLLYRRVDSDTKDVGCLCPRVLDELTQTAHANLKWAKPKAEFFPSFCHSPPPYAIRSFSASIASRLARSSRISSVASSPTHKTCLIAGCSPNACVFK